MKINHLFSLLVFCFMAFALNAGQIVLEGNYMSKNVFVKNPFGGSSVGFCVFEVTVNGKLDPAEVNQSAFEVDFSTHNLKLGDPLVINIKHKDDCAPEVLNPEVLKPKSTFNTKSISFTDDGILEWTTDNENGQLDYIVEQFRWNKWVKLGEVRGEGTPGTHNYSFKITPHSGENKVRVKQTDFTGRPRYSKSATYNANVPAVTLDDDKFKGQIEFKGGETLYELYERYGTIVKKGFGSSVNVENLEKGLYYVSFDNTTKDISIK